MPVTQELKDKITYFEGQGASPEDILSGLETSKTFSDIGLQVKQYRDQGQSVEKILGSLKVHPLTPVAPVEEPSILTHLGRAAVAGVRSLPKIGKQLGETAIGTGEAVANLAGQAFSFLNPIPGLAGLTAPTSPEEGTKRIRQVQEAMNPYLVYEPQTEEGKKGKAAIEWVFGKLQKAGEIVGGKVQDVTKPLGETVSAGLGATAASLTELIPIILGPKYLASIKNKVTGGGKLTFNEKTAIENHLRDVGKNSEKIIADLKKAEEEAKPPSPPPTIPKDLGDLNTQFAKEPEKPVPTPAPEEIIPPAATPPAGTPPPLVQELTKIPSEGEKVAPEPAGEAKARPSLVLKDGTILVGGDIHPDIYNNATKYGIPEDALNSSRSGFTEPSGRTFDLQGKDYETSGKIIDVSKPPVEPGKVGVKKPIIPRVRIKEANTFVEWVRQEGGIWDEQLTGKTRRFQGKESGIIGLVSKKGKSFDELAQRAMEDGWLPEGSTERDVINLIEQDAIAAKQGKPRAIKAGEEKAPEMPKWEPTPEEQKIIDEQIKLEKEGFEITDRVDVGNLKVGDQIVIDGEKFTVKGMDENGLVTFEDGRTIKKNIFDVIRTDAVKIEPVEKAELSAKEKKDLGLTEDQAKILGKIREENPEEYAKILKGNTAELVKEWETKRLGKAKAMRQGEMFAEPKAQPELGAKKPSAVAGVRGKKVGPEGEILADTGGYAKRPSEKGYDYSIGKETPARIEMPELVELYGDLASGKTPKLRERLRVMMGKALGQFNPVTGEVTLRKDIFRDIETATKTLSHELGHLVDWIPDKYLKRGNILGHIGSLRRYIKTLLEEYPKDTRKTYGVLTGSDRVKLRKEAERQLKIPKGEKPREVTADDILQVWNAVEKANPKLKEYIAILSREQKVDIAKSAIKGKVPDWVTFRYEDIPTQDIRDIYRKLVEEEIEKRRLYEKDKIMQELKDLTQVWKPFNIAENSKYTQYRHSPVELYADAVSVLFNEPKLLKDTAPSFHKAFFAYLERKPEVMKSYEEIQARIKRGPEDIARVREERMETGMQVAEESWRKALEPAAWEDKFTTKVKKMFSDKYASVFDFTKEPNTRHQIENLIYEGAEQQFYFNEVASKVTKPLEKAKIKIQDLEKLYTLNAILKGSRTIKVAGEDARVSIANPYGISKETAPSVLAAIKYRYGEAGFKKLEEAQKAHWEIRQYVIKRLEDAKVFPQELMERIKDNEFYAHFLINDYIQSKYGIGVKAGVYRQVGTLRPNAPAFTATVMKDLSLLVSVQRKLAVKAVIDDMHANYPEFIKPAQTQWNGKIHVPIESKVKGEGLLSYSEEGKIKGFYVPEGVAEAFKKNPVEAWAVSRWLGNITDPFRKLFISWNPGFWLFNLRRDFSSAILTLPQATIKEYGPLWVSSYVPAMRDIFKGYDPLVQQMLKEKSLIPSFDYQGMLTEDIALERMMVKFALKDPTLKNPILNQFDKFFRFLDKVAAASERVPKIAAYRYLKEKFPNMSVDEVADRVRRAGSPPFLIKGQATPILNNIFLFSNAFIRGTEMHWKALKESPVEYSWKMTKYSLMPKILMYAGSIGLLGETIKKIYELSSDYDNTNYFVIPLGTTKEGKGVTLRVPFDEQSRLLTGVFWKLLVGIKSPKDAMKLFDYTAGQFPGVNPAFSMAGDLISYLSGQNPYDSFRGRLAIPEMIFKAQDRRSVEAFAKYLANQGGLGILYKFENDDLERVKGEMEKVLGYPIVSNVLGRFIKITDKGISDKLQKETEPIARDLARINLDVKDALTKIINNKPKEITQQEINSINYKIQTGRDQAMINQIRTLLVRKGGFSGSRYLESYLKAPSKEEKAKIMSIWIEDFQKAQPKPQPIPGVRR